MASDHEFLTATLRATCAVDDFTARLMDTYTAARAHRSAQYTEEPVFAITRYDFMLHCPEDTPLVDAGIKNVELNTIAASLPMLSARVTRMHRHFLVHTLRHMSENDAADRLPVNDADKGVVHGFQVSMVQVKLSSCVWSKGERRWRRGHGLMEMEKGVWRQRVERGKERHGDMEMRRYRE